MKSVETQVWNGIRDTSYLLVYRWVTDNDKMLYASGWYIDIYHIITNDFIDERES